MDSYQLTHITEKQTGFISDKGVILFSQIIMTSNNLSKCIIFMYLHVSDCCKYIMKGTLFFGQIMIISHNAITFVVYV